MPVPAAYADEIDDVVAELRELAHGGDETRVTAKITALERKRDRRIDAELMTFVRSTSMERAAKEAMRILALHRDASFLSWAKTKINDSKMLASQPLRYTAMMDSLPGAQDALKPCLKTLTDCTTDTAGSRPEVATRAVKAIGAIRDKSAVETCFFLLDELDAKINGGGGGGGAGGAKPLPPPGQVVGGGTDSRANAQIVVDAVYVALKEMTGVDRGNKLDWKIWWRENSSSFRFPRREPDWPTIEEYTDDVTGLVLKKPAGPKPWVFEKCEFTGGLACLKFQDAASVQAKVDVMAYPKGEYTDAADFLKTVEEMWRHSEFSEFTEKGEPAATPRKIGGRDFVVLAARGTGSGSWKDWNDCERRVYVTLAGSGTFLALEGIARGTCDETQRAALWSGIESVTFRKQR